jgi:FKBP-type peptidyl-prolyl cis-trans isomerase
MIKRILFCMMGLLMLMGCKQNNWMDWKVQNELWLEQNAQQEGVQTSASGLQYKVIANPTPQDARPNSTSSIQCDYTVKLINGYQVDAGNQVTLNLNNVIPGFAEGCTKINNNGDIELYIPCYLGYDYQKYQEKEEYDAEGFGTEGTSGYIPPYSTLIYTIHICSVLGN